MSPFLFVSLAILFFLCFLENNFAIQTHHDVHQYTHLVHINSLLPSSSCSSSNKGPKNKASLNVVHKHGPCSQLNNGKTKILPTHNDILNIDKERVNYIHNKISKKKNMEELDSSNLPAKSGSLIGSGNYFVVVGLGSPKRDLSLIFDTGSDLTWTQCQPCARSCYKQQDEIYDPSKSTSYQNITCTTSECTQLSTATGNEPGCAKLTNACIYGIQYGDQSFSVGYFGRERLTVTAKDSVDGFLFGCGQNNQGLFGGSAGLLGLGRHPISFVQQTSLKYHKTFSYCLPSTSSAIGHLTFGATSNNYVKYTPFSTTGSNSFYGLDIVGITVAGTKLPISSSIFSTGGAIIDSGTVITRLPPTAYSVLRQKGHALMFPKGGWELDESVEEAACRESLEEAGVIGKVECELGQWNFISKRHGIYYEGYMFPLFVKEQLDHWPEKNLRRRIWMTVAQAREVCQHWWMKEALDILVQRLDSSNQQKNRCSMG